MGGTVSVVLVFKVSDYLELENGRNLQLIQTPGLKITTPKTKTNKQHKAKQNATQLFSMGLPPLGATS